MPNGILDMGVHVPPQAVDNERIAAWAGVTLEWLDERTGVKQRRYAAPGVGVAELSAKALGPLLETPEARERLGTIIMATSTPDQPIPGSAPLLAHKLGISGIPAFDVDAGCAGFVHGLMLGDAMLAARPELGTVAVIGADTISSYLDRADRKTISIFGDGAGAVLMGPVPDGYGLRSWQITANGEHYPNVGIPAGGGRDRLHASDLTRGDNLIKMDGRKVREYIYTVLPKLIADACAQAGITLDDVDRAIFHQANPRLLEDFADRLGLDRRICPITADRYGNTASGSMPITLYETNRERPFKRGDRILLAAVGAGLIAAAAVLVWY